MNKKLYAFWSYDLFPYVLGGEIKDMREDGLVLIEAYHSWFKPILILPFEKGQKIREELKKIERSYKNEIEKVRKNKLAEVIDVCPQLLPYIQ